MPRMSPADGAGCDPAFARNYGRDSVVCPIHGRNGTEAGHA
jgi:hypothetical protein